MNKSTKGALAAGAAAVLLLGGAGSLAFWTDSETIDGGTVESGHLKLADGTCGDGWLLDGGAVFVPGTKLVPGDTLTKTCSYTVDAAGDHLTAELDATGPTDVAGAQALVDELEFSASYELNGSAVTDPTDVAVADNDALSAVLMITWPYGVEDNDSNVVGGLQATLDAVTVTVTQNHN